ncbi:hypothetical protein G9A89_008204 [Geosiphon pyriformis]|nr:hypothetical protein G9A89_008204 [Geosiphon pyriformis]
MVIGLVSRAAPLNNKTDVISLSLNGNMVASNSSLVLAASEMLQMTAVDIIEVNISVFDKLAVLLAGKRIDIDFDSSNDLELGTGDQDSNIDFLIMSYYKHSNWL